MENSWLEAPSPQTPLLPLLDQLTARFDHSYDDSEDAIDEDRCFQMEIDQLKRENSFLKKKIAELTRPTPARPSPRPRQSRLPPHAPPPPQPQPPSNYIVAFFEEITRLLEEFSNLFKIGSNSSLTVDVQGQAEAFNALTLESGEDMGRQLGRILLAPEEQRFSQLLGVFESYYRESVERRRELRGKIEWLTGEAIEVGKRMAEEVRSREKVRGSRVLSVLQSESLENCSVRSSFMSELDLSMCRHQLQKEKMFLNIF